MTEKIENKLQTGSFVYYADKQSNYFGLIDDLSQRDNIGLYTLDADYGSREFLYDFMFATGDTPYEYFDKGSFVNYVPIEPVNIRAADIRKILSGEITLREYLSERGESRLPCGISARGSVKLTPDMMLTAVKRFLTDADRKEGICDFIEYAFVLSRLRGRLTFPDDEQASFLSDFCSFRTDILPVTDEFVTDYVIDTVRRKPSMVTDSDLEHIAEYLEKFIFSKGKRLSERDYTDFTKENFIKAVYENNNMDHVTYEEIILYRDMVTELCDKGSREALRQRAYGCYGNGNRAFPADWQTSMDCLQQLYLMDGNPFIANTLGYMYYYGRTNEGEPQYDMAIKYFSVGAFAGYYQSMYKMGDIYAGGLGVRKQPYIAYRLYTDVYNSTYDDFRQQRFDYEFADAALRIAGCYKDGTGVRKDYMTSYRYYLEAMYAINKRMECSDNYGDSDVREHIAEGMRFVENQLAGKIDKSVIMYRKNYPWLFGTASGTRRVEVNFRHIGFDRIKFTLALLEDDGTRTETGILIAIPEIGYCRLLFEPVFYADGIGSFWCMSQDRFVYNNIIYNPDKNRYEFRMYEELVASLRADEYTFKAERDKNAPADDV